MANTLDWSQVDIDLSAKDITFSLGTAPAVVSSFITEGSDTWVCQVFDNIVYAYYYDDPADGGDGSADVYYPDQTAYDTWAEYRINSETSPIPPAYLYKYDILNRCPDGYTLTPIVNGSKTIWELKDDLDSLVYRGRGPTNDHNFILKQMRYRLLVELGTGSFIDDGVTPCIKTEQLPELSIVDSQQIRDLTTGEVKVYNEAADQFDVVSGGTGAAVKERDHQKYSSAIISADIFSVTYVDVPAMTLTTGGSVDKEYFITANIQVDCAGNNQGVQAILNIDGADVAYSSAGMNGRAGLIEAGSIYLQALEIISPSTVVKVRILSESAAQINALERSLIIRGLEV